MTFNRTRGLEPVRSEPVRSEPVRRAPAFRVAPAEPFFPDCPRCGPDADTVCVGRREARIPGQFHEALVYCLNCNRYTHT